MAFDSSFSYFGECLTRLKTILDGYAALNAYNEIVDIRKYRPDHLPDFKNYAVILSPESETENNWGDNPDEGLVNGKHHVWNVHIVAIVRNYHPVNSLVGTTVGGVGVEGVGIIRHVSLIKDALRAKSLSGYLEVTKYELDGEIAFNTIQVPERNNFFHEVVIPWQGNGKFEVMPNVV